MADTGATAGEPFGLYVHWPYCLAKCPYCDFNSHVRSGIDADAFGELLLIELAHFAGRTPGRRLTSMFFGGGTPSLMPPEVVARIIDAAAGHWSFDPDVEITLEANPTSVEAGNFRGYRSAGVNRLSVGIQALNDTDLRFLGRQHSGDEALNAYRLAASLFPRTSFDMIYARPGQTAEAWREELTRALGEQNGHMSLYQLTIEPGTAFARLHSAGKLRIPDDVSAIELYELTQELTTAAGLEAYEISNHAVPGDECRHNILYWTYGEYAGIGPGAHSRLIDAGSRLAVHTISDPAAWGAQVGERGHGIQEQSRLTPEQAGEEYVMMGLRQSRGINRQRFTELAAQELATQSIDNLVEHGLLTELDDSHIATTARGRHVLNAITSELLTPASRPL